MKLREIKEVGFYREINDLDRKTIYEVIENADEDWLKEDPEATLLIDTWLYEYKDENDRDKYSIDGNLLTLYLDESNIDVVKIEDTKYKVLGEMGQFLIEDKPTYKELFKHKEKECERLKWYLKEIRYDELKALDIEWDEYETHCIDSEYSNIINLVEEALKEISSEDCRYDR